MGGRTAIGGDSHHHDHHNHQKLMEDMSKVSSKGTWILQMTLLGNFCLAVVKLVGGWVFKSKALEADAWHSFTDLAADLFALLAVVISSSLRYTNMKRPAAQRIEGLLSLLTSAVLVAAGFHLLWESVSTLRAHALGTLGHTDGLSHVSGDIHISTPSIQAIWPAVLTLLVKECLYRAAMQVANEIKSPVLASNAAHQRADGLMSVVTIVAILGSTVLKNTAWIDSIGGLGISAVMIRAAFESSMESLNSLTTL